MLHASRVNGLSLKIYHARLMIVVKDEAMEEAIMLMKEFSFFDKEGVQMYLLLLIMNDLAS